MHIINKRLKTYLRIGALTAMILSPSATSAKGTESFEVGNGSFLLNSKPFTIKAAEVHYPRIPRPYWEHRIKMCKSLGMNALCVYVFWNIHEPKEGQFDFTGNNDLAEFIRLAQKHEMYVILRPGPYVCAEWEMGGLPWWLLKKKDIRLRERDPYFMERLKIFENEVARQVAKLTIDKGGPILMVQVENEYGSYGEDKKYIGEVRDIIRQAGFDKVTLFQCDWSSNFTKNGLDDLVWTMNFGTGAKIDNEFRRLKELRPKSPLMCSEYWSGWFDKWGGKHETRDAKQMVDGLDEMIRKNISFSLYMTHGGTNWGHWAGANSPGFAPDVTSYDYDAPISESGDATEKFWALRNMMQSHSKKKLPSVPTAVPKMCIDPIHFKEFASVSSSYSSESKSRDIKTMEEMGVGFGSIEYSTILPHVDNRCILRVNEAHDYAQIFINGRKVGTLNRVDGEKEIALDGFSKGDTLTILVEAMGRINFGRAIKDFKGITKSVELVSEIDGHEMLIALKNWTIKTISDDYNIIQSLPFMRKSMVAKAPGYYRAKFYLKRVADTYLDMSTWGKGQVYVNGHAIGRFWNVGPQQTLYMPGCWLKKGENEIIVFDIVGPSETIVKGIDIPIIDKLNRIKPVTHRKKGENLSLEGIAPVLKGTFDSGNGWQERRLQSVVSGRYVCLEGVNSHSGDAYASIAELYILDANGKRMSRETWKVVYCDSEDTSTGNKIADKVFDLQESTYWSTVRKVAYPHQIVIDLGENVEISGFQYLPRVEDGAPGSIKDFRLFVSKEGFSITGR